MPEDSASTRMFPTRGLTNALNVLALVRNRTSAKEDVVVDHAQPEVFQEALQSFRAIQDELNDILADNDKSELDVSRQLERRRTGLPTTMAEKTSEEVFMKQGVAGPSTITDCETKDGPLPLEDDESTVMSSLDSQLRDVAAHPGYPFWRYKRVLHSVPILLPDPITDRGILQKADYVASNVAKHDEKSTTCPTRGTKTRRDGRSVPKIQHYRRPFTRPILCPSARSDNTVRCKQVTCSDTNEGEGIDKLAE